MYGKDTWLVDGTTVYQVAPTGKWFKGSPVVANRMAIQVSPSPSMGTTCADAEALAARIAVLLNS